MNINQDKLDRAYSALKNAFVWKVSPQGHDYWMRVADALESIGAAHDPGRVIGHHDMDSDECEQFCSSLLDAFNWAESSQGIDFWMHAHNDMLDIINDLTPIGSSTSNDPVKAYDRAMKGVM